MVGMTSRQRWLAALRMQPVDRLPFWPKLDAAYPVWRKGRFTGMSIDAIHDFIGSDKHIGLHNCLCETRTRTSVEKSGPEHEVTKIYTTSHGTMRGIDRFDVDSQAWHPVEFPVKTIEDVALMTEIYEDVRVELDEEAFDRVRAHIAEAGEDAIRASSLGTTPLMWFVEHLAGVENAHWMLFDHRGEVEALFDAMHRVNLARAEILAEHHPADILYMIENTSTTLISPEQFRRYCKPHLREIGKVLSARDRLLVFHMCGHLKALLGDIGELPAAGVEAFTAPTLGNTTLLDGRTDMPDKCLVGGTQAPDWTRDADFIIEKVRSALDPLPHHRGIVVTSAGVMPPMCEPETIKAVCEWVKEYEGRM